MRRLVPLAVATTAALALAAVPAGATAPGRNGRIVFLRQVSPAGEDFRVEVINPGGSGLRQVSPDPLECPSWSPDGGSIVTCGGPTVQDGIARIYDADTFAYRPVFSPDPSLFITCPVMSPDSRRLLCDQYDQPSDPGRVGLYSIRSSDGGGLRRLDADPGGHDSPGDWSPDGRRVVFNRQDPARPAGSDQALFVVGADGSGLRQITPWGLPGQEAGGSWSPDGHRILFGGGGEVYVVRPDGTALRPLRLAVSPGSFVFDDPAWAPDGTKLTFAMYDPTTRTEGVFTADANGRHVRPVTVAPIYDAHPRWGARER